MNMFGRGLNNAILEAANGAIEMTAVEQEKQNIQAQQQLQNEKINEKQIPELCVTEGISPGGKCRYIYCNRILVAFH